MRRNEFFDKETEARLLRYPLHSQDSNDVLEVSVQFYKPSGNGVIEVCEGTREANGDWMLYGRSNGRWCYFKLSDLARMKSRNHLGNIVPTLERNIYQFNYLIKRGYEQ